MGFNFSKPIFLILIPFALFVIVYFGRKGKKFHNTIFIIIRSIISLLLIFSLSGLQVISKSGDINTVFVVDLSTSIVSEKDKAIDFIKEYENIKNTKDNIGIVCFGENSVVERNINDNSEFQGISSFVEESGTSIYKGLNTADMLLSESTRKRVVLISDGIENINSASDAAKNYSKKNIEINGYYLEKNIENEVQISNVTVPKNLNKNINYNIETDIYSLGNNSGKINIYKNNTNIISQNIKLSEGSNKFLFKDISDEGGMQTYRVEIISDADTYSENNVFYSHSFVKDIPNILVLGNKDSTKEIIGILESSDVNITEMNPETAPEDLDKLSRYDGIILSDISVDNLPDKFLNSLESYVKNLGGGLFVAGGENSYALGGYTDTILEDILPVNMELKDDKQIPDLGLVMVIDRSGSMGYGEYGISKLEMAKEAAASSVETLTDKDTVGILTFDDSYDWAIPPTSAKNNKETITNRIRQITMGGGTSIYPALQEAYDSLLEIDTKLKHIILLTDGQDSSTGYERLINQMKSDDITLSAVSVGSDSDGKLLKRLTELSGGRYYYTDEFTDLPKIFAKETFLAGKSFINNIDFYPQGDFSSSILSEIDNMPMLKGYISASEKTLADVILSSDEGDPILSTWQYGLGRTVAWTSDIKGNWTDNWLSTDEGVKIIRNAIALTLKKNIDESAAITVEKDGNERELIFELPFSREIENVSAIINDVHNNSYEVDFSSDAPGKYRAKFPDGKPGTYIATMEIEKADSKENYVIGFNIPYGKEYDIREFGKGYSLIEKLAHTTRGKILNSPKDLLSLPDINNERYKDISNTLLISALILFLIDIFLRRFSFLVDKLEAMMYKTINSLGKEKSKNKTEIKLEIKPNKDVSEKEPIIDNEKEKDTSSILLDRMKKRKRD